MKARVATGNSSRPRSMKEKMEKLFDQVRSEISCGIFVSTVVAMTEDNLGQKLPHKI